MPDLAVEDDRRALRAPARRAGRSCAGSALVRAHRGRRGRHDSDVAEGLRDHRALRGRQGDADRASCSSAFPSSSSRSRRPRGRRATGRRTGATTTSSPRRSSTRRVEAGEFLEHATYSGNRYGTLRSEVERRLAAGRSVVLEIEVQGARQVRAAMPEAVLDLHRPARPGGAARAARGPRHRLRRGDRARGCGPPSRSSTPRTSSSTWS